VSEGLRATLRQLEELADELGTPVRYDAIRQPRGAKTGDGFRIRGGLCRVKGKSLIVCDAALPIVDKVFVLAEVLSGLGVELLAMPKVVRKRVRAAGRPVQPGVPRFVVPDGVVKLRTPPSVPRAREKA
jgi:hypothetical protein